eukprot:CAMPEP_0119272562 /NCGR_PEP_ID=MMETSP1329-20130426/8721_1 /TAXON_ID=114041 /ORGANISM="Genus nov. species nov., Strain RCC1024" /LENGTH=227 /DNA_ID=CAMNT_0007272631 /DNA_START=42 /DNA_END=725 /DNA_ORIENTATION=-
MAPGRTLSALALVSGAGALVAPVAPKAPRHVVQAFDASTMEGVQKPFGFFDPLGFTKTSPTALAWYRACELKHGRVAMLACTGFITQALGFHFNGNLAIEGGYPGHPEVATMSFADIAAAGNPVQQWAMVPDLGKLQIIFVISFLETYAEFQKPHYLRGGPIGRIPVLWDPVGCLIRGEPITDTLPEDVKAAKRNSEIANGRLAMIGAMGFSAAYTIDGSVPLVFGQ